MMTFFIIYITISLFTILLFLLFLAERNSNNKSNSCCSGNSQDSRLKQQL